MSRIAGGRSYQAGVFIQVQPILATLYRSAESGCPKSPGTDELEAPESAKGSEGVPFCRFGLPQMHAPEVAEQRFSQSLDSVLGSLLHDRGSKIFHHDTVRSFLTLRSTLTPLYSACPRMFSVLALPYEKKRKRLGMLLANISSKVMRTPSRRKGRAKIRTRSAFLTSDQLNAISG